MKFEAVIEVPAERVRDVLINAMETTCWCGATGGYGYRKLKDWFDSGEGAYDVYDAYREEEPMQLTHKKLRRAIQLMGEKHTSHLSDIVKENDDAITGDVLLQLALFGELMYG